MRRKIYVFFIMAILLFNFTTSYAETELTEEEKNWIKEHKTIIYAPDSNYPPFEYCDKNHKIVGIVQEYLEIIIKETNLELEVMCLETWGQAVENVKAKKADMIVGAKTKSRERNLTFSKPFIEVPLGIITREDQVGVFKLKDLNEKEVAVVEGWITNDYLKENYPKIKIVNYPNAEEAVKAISFGEVDGLIMNLATVSYQIEKNRITNLRLSSEIDFSYELRFGIRNDYKQLVSIIDKVIENITKEEKRDIYNKWITISDIEFYRKKGFFEFICVVVVGIALILVWSFSLKIKVKTKTKELKEELEKSEKMRDELSALNQKLTTSENELREIIDIMPHMIFIKDYQGRFVLANKATAEAFNTTTEKIVGRKIEDYSEKFPKETSKLYLKRDREVIDEFKRIYIRENFTDLNGEKKYYKTTKSPIKIEEKAQICALTVGIDITEEKNAKLKLSKNLDELKILNESLEKSKEDIEMYSMRLNKANRQLAEIDKQATLGALVAGVSHEINTPIGLSITAITHLEEIHLELGEKFSNNKMKRSDFEKHLKDEKESIEITKNNIIKASDLIKNFKRMAIDQLSNKKMRFAIYECIQSILVSLKYEIKKTNHKIDLNCDKNFIIEGNPGNISQIFTNLIMNSLIHGFEHVEKGHIKINIYSVDDEVVMVYEDDGCGVSKENMNKVFEPFFTTKKSSGGSGLGMQIIKDIVEEELNGTIEFESVENEGVRFEIRFKS